MMRNNMSLEALVYSSFIGATCWDDKSLTVEEQMISCPGLAKTEFSASGA